MKIAILAQAINPALAREANILTTTALASYLNKKDDYCCIITNYFGAKGLERYEKYMEVEIFRPYRLYFPESFKNRVKTADTVLPHVFGVARVQKIKKFRFDILLSISANNMMILRALLAKKLYCRNAKAVHLFKAKSSFTNFRIFYRWCNRLDAIVVQTETAKKELVSRGVSEEKISIINSIINTEKFRKLKNMESLKKKRFGSRNILLYYGHFNRFKGVEHLIRSLKYLKTKNVQLIMIPNNDEAKGYYDAVIKEENVKGKISILPADSNLAEHINMADAVVLPYPELVSTESNPSCLIESMACGTPVITSDLPELREIVQHRKSGLLARPKDAKDIAKNIDLILNDKKLREEISKNAAKMTKRFDVADVGERYKKLFRELLKNEK